MKLSNSIASAFLVANSVSAHTIFQVMLNIYLLSIEAYVDDMVAHRHFGLMASLKDI